MAAIAQTVLAKLMLARHLFHLAESEARYHRDVTLFATVNLMQDAVESFLLALTEHLNVPVEQRAEFVTYVDKINERLKSAKLAITELPFRSQLISLNRIRVLSKHQGIQPDRKTVQRNIVDCREFFLVVTQEVFQKEFWSISFLDLLDAGEKRDLLVAAQSAFDEKRFDDCLVDCRKVIFLEIENRYNVQPYEVEDGNDPLRLFLYSCKASYHKKNREWITENVREPSEYVQLDFQQVDSDLLKDGIDTAIFWNIWRLTPAVFRRDESSDWIVRYEPQKVEAQNIADCASYVLEHTIELTLQLQNRRREIRFGQPEYRYVNLKREKISLYTRALKGSAVRAVIPEGVSRITISAGTPALDGNGYFWDAVGSGEEYGGFLHGYLADEDFDWGEKDA